MSKVTIKNPNFINQKIDSSAIAAVNEMLTELHGNILKEIPVSKKSKKHLKGTVKKIRATSRYGGVYKSRIEIGSKDLPYTETLLQGVSKSAGVVHKAKPGKFMVFAGKKGQYNGYYKRGKYYFKQVRYHIPKNNFVGRALSKISRRKFFDTFVKYFNLIKK